MEENNEEKKLKVIASKSLEVGDYEKLSMEAGYIDEVDKMLEDVPHFHQHEHRKWEYALASHVVLENKEPHQPDDQKVVILDVGGAGSTLGAALAMLGYCVHQLDPGDHGASVFAQKEALEKQMTFPIELTYEQKSFEDFPLTKVDIVMCMSVIEHVHNDRAFIRKLGSHVKPGGLLILTTDFHPSGAPQTPWHLRAYNEQGMLSLYGELPDFELLGKTFSYKAYEQVVHEWSFASLVMRKL